MDKIRTIAAYLLDLSYEEMVDFAIHLAAAIDDKTQLKLEIQDIAESLCRAAHEIQDV